MSNDEIGLPNWLNFALLHSHFVPSRVAKLGLNQSELPKIDRARARMPVQST